MKPYFSQTVIALIVSALLISCGLTDDDEAVLAPSLTYSSTNVTATFFEEGNSSAPTINWNGNQGTISLANNIEGLSVNSTTGVINWDKQLKPDDYSFDIIATNSAGQTIVSFNLNNPLQGTFTGTYSETIFYEFEFNADGTVEVRADNPDNPNLAQGTWQLNNDILTADYTYENVNDEFSVSGTLNQSNTQAVYTGNWYNGHGAEEGNERGEFEVVLD